MVGNDWAWQKGLRYGTIMVDLERREVPGQHGIRHRPTEIEEKLNYAQNGRSDRFETAFFYWVWGLTREPDSVRYLAVLRKVAITSFRA